MLFTQIKKKLLVNFNSSNINIFFNPFNDHLKNGYILVHLFCK